MVVEIKTRCMQRTQRYDSLESEKLGRNLVHVHMKYLQIGKESRELSWHEHPSVVHVSYSTMIYY